MARIRTIKPEFWTSTQVVECSPTARLLFVGLWTFADDGGVQKANPLAAKMRVFPGDSFTIDEITGWIGELIEAGLIVEFEAQGVSYWHITGFRDHQKIDKPTLKYPGPFDEGSTTSRRVVADSSPPEGNGREWKGMEGRVMEGNGMESKGGVRGTAIAVASEAAATPPTVDHPVVVAWNAVADGEPLVAAVRRLTPKRASALRARCRDPAWQDAALGMIGDLPFPWQDRPAAFDWLLRPDTVLQWQEGRYQTDTSNPAERRTRAVLNSYLERRDGKQPDGAGSSGRVAGGIFDLPD